MICNMINLLYPPGHSRQPGKKGRPSTAVEAFLLWSSYHSYPQLHIKVVINLPLITVLRLAESQGLTIACADYTKYKNIIRGRISRPNFTHSNRLRLESSRWQVCHPQGPQKKKQRTRGQSDKNYERISHLRDESDPPSEPFSLVISPHPSPSARTVNCMQILSARP